MQAAINFLTIPPKIKLNFIYLFFNAINTKTVATKTSVAAVVIAAPIAPHNFINRMFNEKLNNAPAKVAIVQYFSLPLATKY